MKKLLLAFAAGLVVMAGLAYWRFHSAMQGDEPPSETHRGLFTRTATIPIGEVVDDIHALNRLVVFRAYITATTTTHEIGWFTQTDQTMITPAFVNYYIDMDEIGPAMVRTHGNVVEVQRSGLRIERPNIDTTHVQVFSAGIWSVLAGTADRLRVRNSRMALRQLYGRADMPFLTDAAKAAVNVAVGANLHAALAAGGRPEAEIRVYR